MPSAADAERARLTRYEAVAKWSLDNWPAAAQALSGLSGILAPILLAGDLFGRADGSPSTGGAIVGVFLLLFAIAGVIVLTLTAERRQQRITDLLEENRQLRSMVEGLGSGLFSIADMEIREAAGHLAFGDIESQAERITIYAHDPREQCFIEIARFSENPVYKKKSTNRVTYPDAQGCISLAWQRGIYFAKDYPDPVQDLEGWVGRCGRDGVPDELARRFNMKSRLYFGFRVNALDREPLAVVIVESTDPDRYTEEDLRDFFGWWGDQLRARIEPFRKNLPKLSVARTQGY